MPKFSASDNDDWIKAGKPDFTDEELQRLDEIYSSASVEELLEFTNLVLYRAHTDLFPKTTARLREVLKDPEDSQKRKRR